MRGLRSPRFVSLWLVGAIVMGGLLASSPSATADAWTESSEADFLGGTLTDVVVMPGGDLMLAGSGVPVAAKQGVVLDVGASGAPDDVRTFNPFVLRETTGSYKMWYTGYDGSRFRMMFADSPDGLTWTKRGIAINVLTAPWNFDSVAGMSVIKEGTTYHMWFAGGFWTGGPEGYWARIYYATSSDGLSWSIQGVVLDLGPLGSWEDSMIASPWVVQDGGGLYRLYYNAWDGVTQRIGVATSTTKMGFIRHAGNPILDLGPAGSWDDAWLGPEAVTIGPQWTMYYAANDGATMRLGLAFSSDGYAWTKWPGNPWMVGDPTPAWDSGGLASAAPVWDPAGERLYYAGSDGTRIRTGLALLSSAVSPSGTYVSRVFDSGDPGTTWQTIAWSATVPPATSVALSVRAGDSPTPGGSWTSWAAVTGPSGGAPLSLPRYRYIQYRADLSTADTSVSPSLHDVTVTYAPNQVPTAISLSPASGAWLRTTTPTLAWTPSDPEGDSQSAFEVQLSPDPAFANLLSSGVRSSSVPSWQPPPLGEGAWNWRVRLRDTFGAWGGWSTESFGLDVTPPTTSASLSGALGGGGWYTGPVTVTLAASDATSGVVSTSYRMDGGSWQLYASAFLVAGDGVHGVEFYSTDVAGVVEAMESVSVRIDSTQPVTTSTLHGPLGGNAWYIGPVTVALGAVDVASGVSTTEYRLDGGAWQSYTGPFLVTGEGTHTVAYRSTDNAGLIEADRSAAFDVDTIAPETAAVLSGPPGVAGFFTGPVTVSLAATDETSGVSTTQYRIDGGAWQSYAGPFRVAADGLHVVEIFSTDNAGLEEAVQAVRFSVDTGMLSPTGPFGPWVLVLLVAIAAAFLSLLLAFALWRRKRKEEPQAAPPPEAPEQ